jgi:parallel beta-helix repeat protein
MRLGPALVVGSPAVRMVTLLLSTVLLLVALTAAGVVGARLLSTGQTIVVDQGGGADATTIGDALARATDGDIILVRPGEYVEAVTISRDVVIRGDGERERVVLRAPEDGPTTTLAANRGDPYAILVVDSSPTISQLTLRGERSAIHIDGGRPTLMDLLLEGVGRPHTHSHGLRTFPDAILIAGRSAASVQRNLVQGGGSITIYDPARAGIADNVLVGGPSILSFTEASDTVIRDNVVIGALNRGIGVFTGNAPRVLVTGNFIVRPATDGVSVGFRAAAGTEPIVRDNLIDGARNGIFVASDAEPVVEGNTVTGSETGLYAVEAGPGMSVASNRFVDNDVGMNVAGTGRFQGNRVCGNGNQVLVLSGEVSSLAREATPCTDAAGPLAGDP